MPKFNLDSLQQNAYNPATAFISSAGIEAPTEPPAAPLQRKDKLTRRISLRITETEFTRLTAEAEAAGLNLNEAIRQILNNHFV